MAELYMYSRETFWTSIDRAREKLGYKKNQFSRMLDASPGYFSTCLNDLTDMKISYAWKYAAAVGLTLDEAVRGDGRNRYMDFLEKRHVSYNELPKDSIMKSYLYKSLLPTIYDAADFCRDPNVLDIVKSCLLMDGQHLFQFFFMLFRSDYVREIKDWMQDYPQDFNNLKNSLMKPDVNDLFWRNGVHHKIGEEGLLGDSNSLSNGAKMRGFAERLGISLGQLYKYLRIGDNKTGIKTEPRLSRVIEICNALDGNVDAMIEPCYSFATFSNISWMELQQYDTEFSFWERYFLRNFREPFHALPLLFVIINQYGCLAESERKTMTEMALRMANLKL